MKKEALHRNIHHTHTAKPININADIKKIGQKVGETASAISTTAWHAKKQAQGFASDTLDLAKEKTLEMRDQISTYVRQNPLKSLGFGLLAGWLITSFLRKRK